MKNLTWEEAGVLIECLGLHVWFQSDYQSRKTKPWHATADYAAGGCQGDTPLEAIKEVVCNIRRHSTW